MNKIFRVIWNRTLNMWVVASELATGRTKASCVGKITLKREKELNNISTLKSLTQALFSSGMVSLLTMVNVIGFVSWSNQANADYIDIGQSRLGGRFNSSSSPNGSISIGDSAKVGAGGENSIAIGTGSKIRGTGSGDMGGATVAHRNSIAIGYNAKAWGVQADDSVALGSDATAGGISTIAIGKGSNVVSVNGLAIGTSTNAGNHAIALGASARATATKGISIGESSQVTSNNSIAIGDSAKATTSYSTALGSESSAEGNVSTALGNGAKTKGARSIALGTHAYVEAANNTDSVENSIAIGSDSRVKKENSIAIGQAAEVLGGYSVAVGQNSKALDTGTSAFGENSKAQGERATALGNNSKALQQNAVAVGFQANANADSAIAIGKGASVAHAHSVALGSGTTATAGTARSSATFDSWTLTWNGGTTITNNATVNVGGRQIQSIAAGDVSQDSTDAINGSQLWALADTKMTFAGDTGTSAQRRIGDTMNIKGATGSIFTFEGNGSDTLTLKLNKANTGNLVQGSNVSVTGDLNNRLIGAGNVTIDLNQTSKDLLNKVSSAGKLSVTGNDLTLTGTGVARLLGAGDVSIGLSNDAQTAINNAKNKGNLTVDTTYLTISNGAGRLLGNTEAKIELSSNFKQKIDKIKTYNIEADSTQTDNPISITSNTTGDNTTFKLKLDETKLKKISSGAVHVAGGNNVTVTEGAVDATGKKTYTINVSDAAIASKAAGANLAYKANGTGALNTTLSQGLDFINGTHTNATVEANGKVKFDLNDAAKTAITRATSGGITFRDSANGSKKVTLENEVKFIGSSDIRATVSGSGNNAHITLAINKDATITDAGPNGGLVTGATVKTYVDKVKDEINASVSSQANLKFDGNSKTGTPKVNLGSDTLSIKGEANSFVTTEANDKTLTIKIDETKFKSAVGSAAATSAMLKYKGGADTTGKEVALGTGLNFQGQDNVEVTIGESGLVTHKLAKALKGITSIAHGDNGSGAKLTLDANKLSINNKKLDGLANADLTDKSTEAVTGQQLKKVKDTVEGNTTNITNLSNLLGDGKLKFVGNTGGDQTVALKNEKLSITGDGSLVKTTSSATGLAIAIDDAKLKEKVQGAVDVVGTGIANVTSQTDQAGKKTFTVNVAEDRIKTLSQDAVNVVSANDLVSVSSATSNGVKTFTLTANANKLAEGIDFTYKANGAGDKTVKLNQGLNFTNGTNSTAEIGDNGVVKFNVNPALTNITSIAGSGTTVTFGNDGLSLNNKKITGLEDARLDADSSDAVTGRQLHNVSEKVGNGKLKFTGNTTTPDTSANVPSVALNGGALNIVGDTTAGKDFITTAAQGQNLTISIDQDKFKSAVATAAATGTVLKYKAADEDPAKEVLLGTGLHFKSGNTNITASTAANGEVTYKLADALTGITSVTGLNAGEISGTSTAAINGNQLHTLATALGLTPNNNLFANPTFTNIKTLNGATPNELSSNTIKGAVDNLITATNKGLVIGASQAATNGGATENTHYLGSTIKINPLTEDFTNGGNTFKGGNLVTTYEKDANGNANIGIGLKEEVVLKSVKGLDKRDIPSNQADYGKGDNENRAATEGAVRNLSEAGLKFRGNAGANNSDPEVARQIGEMLRIEGEGTVAGTTAANNIRVDADTTANKLVVKLADALTNIHSIRSATGTNPFELSKDAGLAVASRSNNKVYASHTLGDSFEIKSADDVTNPTYSTAIKLDGATKTATIGDISINGATTDKSITGLAHRVAQNGTSATADYGVGANEGSAATEGAVRALTLNLVGNPDKSTNATNTTDSTGSVKLSEQSLSVKGEKGITVVAQNQGYTVSVDNDELVKNVKLSYKAEGEKNKRETTLGEGLLFNHGDNTTAVTDTGGVVKINVNPSLKNITDISGKPEVGKETTKLQFGEDRITLSTINNAGDAAGTKDPKLTGLGKGELVTSGKDAVTAGQIFDLNEKLGLTLNTEKTGFENLSFTPIQTATGTGNDSVTATTIKGGIDSLISAVNKGMKFGADNNKDNPTSQFLGSSLNVVSTATAISENNQSFVGKNLVTKYDKDANGNGTIALGISETPEFKAVELKGTSGVDARITTTINAGGTKVTGPNNQSATYGLDKTEITDGTNTTTLTKAGVDVVEGANKKTSITKAGVMVTDGTDSAKLGANKLEVAGVRVKKDGSNKTGSIVGLTERSAAKSGNDYGNTAENRTRAATEGAVRELADQVSLQDDSSPFEYASANGNKLLKGKDGKFYTPEQLKNAVWDPNTNTYTGLTGTDVAAADVVIKAKGVGHQVTNLLSGMGLTTNYPTDIETARNKITGLTNLADKTLNNAATVGDLKTLAIAGLNFKGNVGDSIHRNLGQELTIKGGMVKTDADSASAENLRVDNENNELIIKLAKAIKNIESIASAPAENGKSSFELSKNGLKLTSKDTNGADTVSVSNANGTAITGPTTDGKFAEAKYGLDGATVKGADGQTTTVKPAEVEVKDPTGNTASLKPTEIKVADVNGDNVTTIGNDKISMQNGKDGANGKDGMDLTASNIVFKSKDPVDKTSSTLDKKGLVFTDDKGNEVIKLDATTGVINKLSSGAKTYDEPELEGEKLKQANDGQWYLAKDVDSKGVPASGKTPAIAMADDGKYYKVNAAGKADTSTPEIAIGKAGLIDFAKSDETAAATVADLKNLGFEVNVKDKTGTSTYKDQVRHGNTLSVSGSKDGLVHVTGKTTNGERELIIDVKRAEHIVEKGTGLDKDGNRLVKVGDNYYKPEDVNSDGTVIAGRQPVADDKIAVRDTDGNGFVTGNQVGAALSKSGFVVGKGEASDMEGRQENRDEHINPNDELRFADGKNTTVTLTTKEDVDATGNHKTVTNVRIDVDLPIADKYTINKDGKEVEVVKGKDGKFYDPKDVDKFGKPKANAQAIDIAATPVKRDIKLEGSDYTIGTNGTEKDAIVKGSGGVNINNVAWAENPDQAINKDQLDKTVNAGGFFVKNNGNSVRNPADNVAEKVTNKDIVDFVDGANTRISVDTTRDPATGVDTSKISVHVTDLPTKHTVYIDGKETIVTKVGGKYYAVGENARPDTSKEIPANIIAGAKVNVANVAAKPNEIGAKTRLGNVASATESIAADPSFKTVDFNGDIYDARDVVVTYKLKDPKAALVKVGEGEDAKYYRPEDLTFEYGKVTVKAGKEGDNVKNVVVVDGHAYDKENAKPTGTRLLDNAEALVKVGEGDNAQFYRQSDMNSGTPRAGAVAVNSKAHRDHKAFAGIADLNGANRADVITVDDAKRMGFVVGTRNVDPNNASAYADKIQNANKLEIVGDNNIEVVGVTKGNTREVTVNVVKNPKFDSVELGHRDPATGKHTKGPKLSGDRNGDLVLTKQARDQDGNILRDQNNQPILTNVRISGVAAGRIAEDSTDAVNGSQIYNLARSFGQQLHDTKQRLSSGIAGAYAMSSLIQSSLPGEKVVSIAGGTYEGQTSVALGFSATTDNGKFTIKAAGTRSGTGELGGSIGAGYRW